jgi:uncharacterized CHY-type Zn-finger protein
MYITKKQLLDCIKESTIEYDTFIEVRDNISDSGKSVKVVKLKFVDSEKFYNMINDLQEYQPVPIQPFPSSPQENIQQCMKCGISLTGVMSYSCPRSDCCTGLGSPFCLSAQESKTSKPFYINPRHVDNPKLTWVYHNGTWYEKDKNDLS